MRWSAASRSSRTGCSNDAVALSADILQLSISAWLHSVAPRFFGPLLIAIRSLHAIYLNSYRFEIGIQLQRLLVKLQR